MLVSLLIRSLKDVPMKYPLFVTILILLFFVISSCSPPAATQLKHGGDFSNIRSEIVLNNGETIFGYASLNLVKGDDAVRFKVPGERAERLISLSEITKLKAEEHEFVVKWIETPYNAVKEGKPRKTRAMIKRMGMESDPVQVFEYKYAVRNPKSPIHNFQTTWYVSFPNEAPGLALCELASSCYKQKWATIVEANNGDKRITEHAPASVKHLLEAVKKIDFPNNQQQNFGIAE
jgi:hypothetical protein